MNKKEDLGLQQVVVSSPTAPVFRHEYNGHLFKDDYEKPVGKSLTIPDEAMTIAEIVGRFASGMPVNLEKIPIYDGDEEGLTDIQKLDLVERRAIVDEYLELKNRIDEDVKARRDAAEKKRLDDLVEERIKEKEQKRAEIEKLKKEVGDA